MNFELYETSSAQKRLYVMNEFQELHTAYNLPIVLLVEGEFDRFRFKTAITKLVQRHETLRTAFVEEDGEILQKVYDQLDVQVAERTASEENIENNIESFIRPFDLNKAPLFRVELVELLPAKYLLLMDIHHIIADGISIRLIFEELIALYHGIELPALDVQYVDFTIWQNDFFDTEEMKSQEAYWLSTFSGEIPVLDLPLDYPRPLVQTFSGDKHSFTIDPELSKVIQLFTKQEGVTLYMFLLAVYSVLLSKYSGQENVVVGSPIAGRKHVEFEKIIGMFVNTLAMRNEPKGEQTFRSFLQEVKENTLAAFANQDFPLEELIRRLNIPYSASRHPLFDTMLVLQNTNNDPIEIEGVTFTPYALQSKTTKFDLFVEVNEYEHELHVNIEYNTSLFHQETIERLAGHWRHLICQMIMSPEQTLSEFELATQEEKQQLIKLGSQYQLIFPLDKTITQLFEEQVSQSPNAIALVLGDEHLTYSELNVRANRLARLLRKKGIGPDRFIGVMLNRSFEMLISIFAILKAGAAYVPLDPAFTPERISYILHDSKAQLIIASKEWIGDLDFSGEILYIEDECMSQGDGSNLEEIHTPKNLAYAIYTSGSTGQPKGVMIEHQNVVHLLYVLQHQYSVSENDAYLLKTTFTFDVSVVELFGWFLGRGRLVILEPELHKDPRSILHVIHKHHVTHINMVPAMLTVFLKSLTDDDRAILNKLKYVFVAGEAITQALVDQFYQRTDTVRLENLYGPTETTVYATSYSLLKSEEHLQIPIGRPLANVQAYVINPYLQLQPIGVMGELCIAGDGLARGYLNRTDLTEEKFVEAPFLPGTKMYRTGDVVKWLPDGNLEFLGRADNQVKIRGMRIELGEIEAYLMKHEEVKAAIVMDIIHQEEKYLCAYYMTERSLPVEELRRFLGSKLPSYMVPDFFVHMLQLPMTSSGKVDRKALPKPEMNQLAATNYVAPVTTTEQKLTQIFEEILGLNKVGVMSNFFEMGGHSLLAAALAAKIHQKLDIEVSVIEIHKHPTVRELSKKLMTLQPSPFFSIPKAQESSYYPLSAAQKRIYIVNQLEPNSTAFNIWETMIVKGEMNYSWFEKIFQSIVRRHESLRTSFQMIEGEPVQIIHDEIPVCIEVLDKGDEELDSLIQRFIRPFDLSQAPLIRAGLIKIEQDVHLFIVDMHHSISDGTSLGILIQEFNRLCRGEELEPIQIQYKDFAVWQNSEFQSKVMKNQEDYWMEQFSDYIPAQVLPTDYPRLENLDYSGHSLTFELQSEQLDRLYRFAREHETTLFNTLLAAYNILLYKYTAKEDIVVGVPVAGRHHIDLENVVGMFVNTLAIRNYPMGHKTVREFIKEVKETVLEAFENQDYQLEELIASLGIKRDVSRHPLFDTMFVLQNMVIPDVTTDHLHFEPYDRAMDTSQGDLSLITYETQTGLTLVAEYRTSLFKKETVELLGQDFLSLLLAIIDQPDESIINLSFREEKTERSPELISALEEDFSF